jgi:hypothetical protein
VDPGTWILLFSALSAAASITSSVISAKAAQDAGYAQADEAEFNALAAQQDAQAEEERRRRLAARELAHARGRSAKANVVFEGTNVDFQVFAAEEFEIDALNVRREGIVKSTLLRAQATGFAKAGQSQSRALLVGGVAQASGTLLGGASSYAAVS